MAVLKVMVLECCDRHGELVITDHISLNESLDAAVEKNFRLLPSVTYIRISEAIIDTGIRNVSGLKVLDMVQKELRNRPEDT